MSFNLQKMYFKNENDFEFTFVRLFHLLCDVPLKSHQASSEVSWTNQLNFFDDDAMCDLSETLDSN